VIRVELKTTATSAAASAAPSLRGAPDAALALYRERGYHIESGLVPAGYCDELLAVALSRPNATDGSFRPIPMPHRDHPGFLAMMRYRPIVEIVEKLVGGKASGIGGEFFYMRPGTPGFSAHQDNFYVDARPDAFVSVWTALCDVGPENGGLVFFPGSHKLGALPIRNGAMLSDAAQNPGAQAVECILPDDAPTVDVRLSKGSVAFFHSLLPHRSGANVSDRFRYSFLATYIRAGSPFRAGRAQQRTEVDLYTE
jgi:phytanoyl-CoA hydroxylase